MKKNYAKPVIEIETYALSASIAASCGSPISLGPAIGDHDVCDEFKDSWETFAVIPGIGIQSNTPGKPFYNDNSGECDCYYSSGGGLYFTS